MIAKIREALGWLTGSLLGVAIIAAFVLLPVCVVLWIGSALGVPWAIEAQVRVYVWVRAAHAAATDLLPPWAWFWMLTLLWLSFLDVHVRGLVRDELSKQLKAQDERGDGSC
jgi:hypothetical protein